MAKNNFHTFDSDMHVYDPAFLYAKYMNPKWGERIPKGQRNGRHGRVEFAIGGGERLRAITDVIDQIQDDQQTKELLRSLVQDEESSAKWLMEACQLMNGAKITPRPIPIIAASTIQRAMNMATAAPPNRRVSRSMTMYC